MNSININLIPQKVIQQEKRLGGLTFLNKISVAALIVMVFFGSITFGVRLLQRFNLQGANENLALAQSRVESLGDRDLQLALLKEYLSSITSISTLDEKRKAVFSLVIFLAPADIQFSDVNIGRDGNTVISASSTSLISIDKLLSDLVSPEKNAGIITKVDIDGLAYGKEGIYHFGLKVVTK